MSSDSAEPNTYLYERCEIVSALGKQCCLPFGHYGEHRRWKDASDRRWASWFAQWFATES